LQLLLRSQSSLQVDKVRQRHVRSVPSALLLSRRALVGAVREFLLEQALQADQRVIDLCQVTPGMVWVDPQNAPLGPAERPKALQLDEEGLDLPAGAQELGNHLPIDGHVILGLTATTAFVARLVKDRVLRAVGIHERVQ
jgi:hypothetical protein